jgi:hypothetical protein
MFPGLRQDHYSRASRYGSSGFTSGQTEYQSYTRTTRYPGNPKFVGKKDQIGKKVNIHRTKQEIQVKQKIIEEKSI